MALIYEPWNRDSGDLGMVSWQRRRPRRAGSKTEPAAIFTALCAIPGAAGIAGQMLGWLHWTGPLALAPEGLVLAAVSGQLIIAAGAAIRWLNG